mmetsp:Transcript_82733/g.181791  ORF Transcript_82733/g.181791 Transcript_82733/m.181791 type:complete len:283 (-) Transcript_82733:390-1238(-)
MFCGDDSCFFAIHLKRHRGLRCTQYTTMFPGHSQGRFTQGLLGSHHLGVRRSGLSVLQKPASHTPHAEAWCSVDEGLVAARVVAFAHRSVGDVSEGLLMVHVQLKKQCMMDQETAVNLVVELDLYALRETLQCWDIAFTDQRRPLSRGLQVVCDFGANEEGNVIVGQKPSDQVGLAEFRVCLLTALIQQCSRRPQERRKQHEANEEDADGEQAFLEILWMVVARSRRELGHCPMVRYHVSEGQTCILGIQHRHPRALRVIFPSIANRIETTCDEMDHQGQTS